MLEEFHSRARDPLSVYCILCASRHFPVGLKSPEVVNSDDINHLHGHFHAFSPPRIVVFLVLFPFVNGISPKLSQSSEGIWRATGLCGLVSLSINLEELWVCPDVNAVPGDIDGDISDYLDSKAVGESVKLIPLCEEEILQDLVDLNLM